MHGSFAEIEHRRSSNGTLDDDSRSLYRARARSLPRRMMRSLGRHAARLLARFAAWNRAPIRIRPLVINRAG